MLAEETKLLSQRQRFYYSRPSKQLEHQHVYNGSSCPQISQGDEEEPRQMLHMQGMCTLTEKIEIEESKTTFIERNEQVRPLSGGRRRYYLISQPH